MLMLFNAVKKCVEKTLAFELISQCSGTVCDRKSDTCWKDKEVCAECAKNGQISYSPAIRACSDCINSNT